MKHSGKLHQLYGADDETIEQLSTQMPPDWDMDAVFEKSYQKYLARSASDPDAPPAEELITMTENRARKPYLSVLVTAACMVLCFATVGTILYSQRNMLTMQPVPEETNATETAAETQATVPVVDPTAPTEALPVVVATDMPETQASEPTERNLDGSDTAETSATESSAQRTTEAQRSDPTEPPAQNQTEPPKQNATEPPTEMPTQKTEMPTMAGEVVTPPPGDGERPMTGEPVLLEDDAPADSVFKITRRDNRISFSGAGPDLPFVEGTPNFGFGNFTCEPFSEGDPYTKHYSFTDQDTGKVFILHLFRYNAFSMMNFTDDDPNGGFERIWINGREGFRSDASLFWDHDGGIALLQVVPEDMDTAMRVAENLYFE